MADTSIEWADKVWNPVVGCSIVSAGCTHCYAQRMAGRLEAIGQERYAGLTQVVNGNRVWTGEVRCVPEKLRDPLRWMSPQRVFVCSQADLFHAEVPEAFIDEVFLAMWQSCRGREYRQRHTFQVLTKRAERLCAYLAFLRLRKPGWFGADGDLDLGNIWVGVSAEDQKRADERIPLLLGSPVRVRFVSCEPLLGPVDLRHLQPDGEVEVDALAGTHGVIRPHRGTNPRVNWVIAGGESGPGARPMHPDWARSLRDQCQAAGVPFFFKQWGEFSPRGGEKPCDLWWEGEIPLLPDGTDCRGLETLADAKLGCVLMQRVGKKRAGRELDGRTWDEMPEVPA